MAVYKAEGNGFRNCMRQTELQLIVFKAKGMLQFEMARKRP